MKKVEDIEIDKIVQSENSRTSYKKEDLHELMSSLRTSGLLQPIGITEDEEKKSHYHVVFGNRRFLAASKLGWKTIPCIVMKDVSDEEFLVKNLTENVQRQELSMPEEGRFYEILKKKGLTVDEIAARVGITKKHVNNAIMAFGVVPKEHRNSIKQGKRGSVEKGHISAGVAINIAHNARNLKKEDISSLFDRVKSGELNTGKVVRITRLMRAGASMDTASRRVEELRTLGMHIPIKETVITKLEAKYKKSIHSIVYDFLIDKAPELELDREFFESSQLEYPARQSKVIKRKAKA